MGNFMPNTPDTIFRTLADPTRRAIFERLVSKTHYLAEPRALKPLIDS